MTSSSGRTAALLFSSLLATSGCGTFNAARPLAPGEHAVGATLGGPLITLGAPLPIPSLVVEGRHGLQPLANRPFDLHYGLNATAAGFGIAQGHVGAAWQLTDAKGGVPALTVANRVFLADNHLAANKAETAERHFWALDQLDLLASWDSGRWLGYTGLSQLTDFRYPGLHLAPVLGGQVSLGSARAWSLQLETRYYGVNDTASSNAVPWVTLGPGALGVNLGVQARWGEP